VPQPTRVKAGRGASSALGMSPVNAELTAAVPFPTAPSAPGSIRFSELTTTSVNVSWEPPPLPNGILEGYRLVYEPCMPVDGEGTAGVLRGAGGDSGEDPAQSPSPQASARL